MDSVPKTKKGRRDSAPSSDDARNSIPSKKSGQIGSHGRVWLEIDLHTLEENYRKISSAVRPCGIVAVLKANAYGLGVRRIAETLSACGVEGFGVAELNEALAIVEYGVPVQILGAVLPDEIPDALNAGVILPIGDLRTAELVSREARRQKKKAEAQFLVDTGMGRLGIPACDAVRTIKKCSSLPGMDFSGIYTHFPVAYQSGSDYTFAQINKFMSIVDSLSKSGIRFRKIHCANSDAINNFPFTYKPPFTHVRTGINIHGSFDSEGRRIMNLKSVITLKTRLSAVRILDAGTSIGYGCTYKLPRKMRVGTISAGYADGLPLALSNRGYVLVAGIPCEILGRVSMDYTTISLENASGAVCGDEVVCLGGEGLHAISVENWANLKGTHPYEIICSFGSRVKRCYSKIANLS